MHGMGNLVLEMFTSMLREAKPDYITMTSVLSACSHSGLVDQGLHYFNNIERVYSITPQMEHYACVVDLLGRAGRLDEAEKLIRDMPICPNEVILGSLMGSCSIHGKPQLAEKRFQDLLELDPYNIECHVLLSNLYDSVGKRSKANHLRHILMKMDIRKVPGMSSIRVKGSIHRFSAGDKSHPRSQEIYSMLDEVIKKLRLAGYVPNMASQIFTSCDGQCNAEELEEKEQALFTHSEKLAGRDLFSCKYRSDDPLSWRKLWKLTLQFNAGSVMVQAPGPMSFVSMGNNLDRNTCGKNEQQIRFHKMCLYEMLGGLDTAQCCSSSNRLLWHISRTNGYLPYFSCTLTIV
ncbi:hypothetical protein Nepgr_024517 [Nepenthes gracilis]|uniref:Pentatricopeptide repeat-containing protein n=1 Tax=Nepenthes gracilis TaxID=150966 RepID=A0AAD3T4R6_NEPGR|nr:hypothetical protein Nepgr_024517 [Nepenthes gracilis]